MNLNSQPLRTSHVAFTQRRRADISTQQRWLALLLWGGATLLAVVLSPPLSAADRSALLYLIALHSISVLCSVRLPGGVHTGLINTSLTTAALILGYRRALLVAPIAVVIAAPVVLLVTTIVPSLRRSRATIAFDALWQSAAVTLSLLPAGWLYEQLGGWTVALPAAGVGAYLGMIGFIVLHFILTTLLVSAWLALSGIQPRRYWASYGRIFVANGLLATVILTPIITYLYGAPPAFRLLGLIPYGLIGLMFFSVTRAQLNLTDRIEDLRALSDIGQAMNASLDINALLRTIYAEIDRLFDASSFYLALVDEPNQRLRFVLVYEEGEEREPQERPFGNGLTEHIVRTRAPLLLNDRAHAEAQRLGLEPEGRPIVSYLGVPMIVEEHVVGVLGLRDYSQTYAFTPADLQLLQTIAASAGVALQNARLYQQSRRQTGELSSLNQVSALVSTSLDLDTVLETVCRVIVDVMGCQKAAVFLLDEKSPTFRMAGSIGLSEEYRRQTTGVPTNDMRAITMRTGEPTVIEDVLLDERFRESRHILRSGGVRGVLEVPLRTGDEVIGALTAYYEQPHKFDDSQIELLYTLAGQVSMAVENARLFAATNARRRELETLYETGRAVNATLSLPRVLRAVATNIMHSLDVDTAAVLLAAPDAKTLRGELWMERTGGLISERPAGDVQFNMDHLAGLRGDGQQAEVVEFTRGGGSARSDLHALSNMLNLDAGLALPLVLHGETFGLIVLGQRRSGRPFEPDTVRLARALADQATLAIQNARLFEMTDVALTRRVDELAALESLSQRMARRLDLKAVIEQVVAAAALATEAEISELLLVDSTGTVLEVASRRGQPRTSALERWPLDQGVVGRALMTGEPVLVGDVSQDADYVATVDAVQSELAVPIKLDDRQLGIINLESVRAGAFDPEQARFVSNLAEHAAIAIQNAQLFEAVQQRADEFQTLRSIAVDLLSSPHLTQTLRVIARHAMERSGAQDIHIYLYDQRTQTLTFGTSLWADGRVDVEFATPRPDGMTATVARTGEALVIMDPPSHPIFADVRDDPAWGPLGAMLSMPLKRGEEVLGVFNIAFGDGSMVSQDTMHFLDLLATQAAVAIANARLAEETRTARDRLQAILNSIQDGILMFDMDGCLVMASARAEELLGQRVDEYLGKHFTTVIRRLRRASRGDAPFLPAEAIQLARQIGADPYRETRRSYELHTPVARVVEETSLPVFGEDERVIGRLFILRDVTRQREMEYYQQEMSNMLVHDLRSPLAGVITGLHMALDETGYLEESIHRDTIEVSVDVALTSANTLLRLVEQLLDVNKLEAGEMALVTEIVDLRVLAEEVRGMLQGTAAEAGIAIEIRAPDRLSPVDVDSDKIKRVLLNLLDNALRYTPSGGQIRIELAASDSEQFVTITDTGTGIPEELRDRVFERFFQGDTSRRQRGVKGSGLGLTFCRLAVEAHGGRIWVSGGPEGGAAVHFALPFNPAIDYDASDAAALYHG